MNNAKSILIFQRPGEMTLAGKWVHKNIIDWAKDIDIPVNYYTDTESLVLHENTIFVAIGGDGTMLRAMDVCVKINITEQQNFTVVGFNAGTLGFLTEDPGIYEPAAVLDEIFHETDAVRLEDRMVLATTINGKEHYAINEFTFTPNNISSPLKYEILINGKYVADHIGSGCLVSTPTGSTAMAMSAGGAIITPSAEVTQIVPIIPHTLSSRPVITSGKDKITIRSSMERVDEVIISSDGRNIHTFTEDAIITVTKARRSVRVWYATGRDFFNVLSTKLDW